MIFTKTRLRFFYILLISVLLSAVSFWLGTLTVSHFSTRNRRITSLPLENPNRDALQAVVRRGFVFERDIETGNLQETESKGYSRNFETNLKKVLVHHSLKRQQFHVTLRRSIVMPGGTSDQIRTYRQLLVAGELATSTTQKQAIEKEKKHVLKGGKVAPIVQASSSALNFTPKQTK